MNMTVLTGLNRFYSGFIFTTAKQSRGGCCWLFKISGRCLVLSILFLFLLPSSLIADSLGQNYYSIQIGSFKEQKWAVNEVKKLVKQGRDAFYQLETIKGKGEFYRVYINKYKHRADAEKDVDQFKQQKVFSYYSIQSLSSKESPPKVEEKGPAYFGQNYYSIQIGSFKEQKWAVNEVKKLVKQGRDAFYQLETIKGKGEFYRVYINKYKHRADAEKDVDQFKQQKVFSYYSIQSLSSKESPPKVEEKGPAYFGQNYYSIQIGSFKEQKWAVNEVKKLVKQGRDAFFQLETIKGKGEFYRVYINKYKHRADAEKDVVQFKQQKTFSSYFIQTLSRKESPIKIKVKGAAHQKTVSAGKSVGNEKQKTVITKIDKAPPQSREPSLRILNVTFKRKGEKTETVSIYGDQHFWPASLFSSQKEVPGVVLVVKNVAGVKQENLKKIDGGDWIRKIHTRFDRNKKTVKIHLDFTPSTTYRVLQLFDKDENIYRFEVTVRRDADGRSSPLAVGSGLEKAENLKIVYQQPEKTADYSDIMTLLEFWRKAWENKHMEDYIACYDATFQSEDKDLAAWKQHKQKFFKSDHRIMVKLSAIKVKTGDKNVRAYFRQKYRAGHYHDEGYKIIELKNVNGHWKISAELWYAEKPTIWLHSS